MADLIQSIDTYGFHESIQLKLSSESGCDSLSGEIIEPVTFVPVSFGKFAPYSTRLIREPRLRPVHYISKVSITKF